MKRLVAVVLSWTLLGLAGPLTSGKDADASRPPYGFRGLENLKLDDGIFGLRSADLDGDGRLDLIVVNNKKARIDVLLRREKEVAPPEKIGESRINELRPPSFFERKTVLTEATLSTLTTGDLNGDGTVDLAWFAKPELVVALGDGKGGFDERRTFRVGEASTSSGALETGDVSGDGKDDLLLLAKDHTAVYRQQADGVLAAAVKIPHSAGGPTVVGAGDLDGDGRGDLVTIYPNEARSFRVRFQQGDGQLGPEVSFKLPPLRTLGVFDLGGGSGEEVVVVQRTSGLLRALGLTRRDAGEGTGIPLGSVQIHPFEAGRGSRKRAMEIGDVDGDGRFDVVVTEPASAQVSIYRQGADGRLVSPRRFPSLADSDALRLADLAGDARREIAVLSRKEKAVGVSALDGAGRLPFPSLVALEGTPQAMDAGDLDGDGQAELVVLVKGEKTWRAVVVGAGEDGKLGVRATHELEGLEDRKDRPEDLLVHDLDQDGHLDLLLIDPYRSISVFRRKGEAFENVSGRAAFRSGLVEKRKRRDVARMDVDGDGKPELVVIAKNFARALVLNAEGALEIVDQVNGRSPSSDIQGGAALDLTGDGTTEVALLDGEGDVLTVLRRNEGGVFEPAASFDLGTFSFERLFAEDLNGDGRPDLVIQGAGRFGVMYAGGKDLELQEIHSFESPLRDAQLSSFDVGDLNGDGRLDIAIAEVRNHMMEIVGYDAKSGFRHELKWQVFEEKMHSGRGSRGEPREVLVGDVDGDGKDDVVLLVHDRILVYPPGVAEPAVSEPDAERGPARPGGRLLVAGAVLVALNVAGALLPRHPDLDLWFGVEAFAFLGPVALVVASIALLSLLASGRLAGAAADSLARAARVPGGFLILLAGLTAAFLAFTNQRMSGDATTAVWFAATGRVYPSNALTGYLHQLVAALPGVDARDAVRLVGVASGVVYAAAARGIAREVFADGARRAALFVLLMAAGSTALFFGAMEVYAPLAAAIGIYLLVGLRWRHGRAPWLLPPLALGVAFVLHGSAGLLLPSLALLANGGRVWPWRVGRLAAWGGAFLLPVALVTASVFLLSWSGEPPEAGPFRAGSFLGAMGQEPLLPLFRTPSNLLHRYAILDLEHLVGVVNLLLVAAPASVLLLLLGRWRGRGPVFAWAGSAAVFLVAFPVVWNVSYPLRRDWDLFSAMGIPLALLAGVAFLGPDTTRRRALRVATLALFGLVPFVLSNVGGRIERLGYARALAGAFRAAENETSGQRAEENRRSAERWEGRAGDRDRVSPTLARANLLARESRSVEAVAAYRRVLEIEPRNAEALVNLGVTLWTSGRREEGRAMMEEAVRAAPNTFLPRMRLAQSYVQEGRDEEAIEHLEKTVRHAGIDREVVDALRLLGHVRRRRGEEDLANLMFDLADRREDLGR